MKRILVAGIGNVFLGDDGFGVEVVQQLRKRDLPGDVHVVDFGVRSYDLAYAIADGYETVILVDAIPRNHGPGRLYLLEPDLAGTKVLESGAVDAHGMNPVGVLQMVEAVGGRVGSLYLLGCEPETLGGAEGRMGLSNAVSAAVPGAVEMLESLIGRLMYESERARSAILMGRI